MNSDEIIKRLQADGWKKVGSKGSHQKFKHPEKDTHVTVQHPRKDIPTGTLRNMFRQAGWIWRPP